MKTLPPFHPLSPAHLTAYAFLRARPIQPSPAPLTGCDDGRNTHTHANGRNDGRKRTKTDACDASLHSPFSIFLFLSNQIHHHLHHHIFLFRAALRNHQCEGHEGAVGDALRSVGVVEIYVFLHVKLIYKKPRFFSRPIQTVFYEKNCIIIMCNCPVCCGL